jgi:hypothetical protein
MPIEGRFADQRGGSEWEPIKIVLWRVELDYAPKFQLRILTRTCQGNIVTTDLPTLGTSPKQITSGSTTQEAKELGNLQCLGRTVRSDQADYPRELGGRSTGPWWVGYELRKIRQFVPYPRTVRAKRRVHDLLTDGPQTTPNKNLDCSWIETSHAHELQNTRRTLGLADCTHNTRGQSASFADSEQKHENESQPSLAFHGSPKRLHGLRQDLGEMWSVPRLGDAMTKNLRPQTN